MCRSGARAAIAGSILSAAGLRVEVVGAGGVPDALAQLGAERSATRGR
jgi:rhodanese-related sulfurtransferase